MRRFFTLISLCNVLFLSVCKAAETGTVRLQGLQSHSVVYVNGKPVNVKNGAVELPVGSHQLQVEQFEIAKPIQTINLSSDKPLPNLTGVFAFRDCVTVQTFGNPDITIKPLPVYPSNIASQLPDWNYGPPGVSGPPGLAAKPKDNINQDEAISLLREAVGSRLADSESRCQMLELEHRRTILSVPRNKFLAYGVNHFTSSYYCMPGPMGRAGHRGIPGDARRLKSEQGGLLLDKVLKQLGFGELSEQKANAARRLITRQEPRKQDFNPNCQSYNSSPLVVYTSRWKNHLDAEYFKFHFVARSLPVSVKASDYSAEGAMGPSGPDGDLPRGQENFVTFSDEQVQDMLDKLMADATIRTKIENLKQRFSKL